jgi:hypothetical protein
MDIITLATTALALTQPFLNKISEGVSRKVGEDIWDLIKRPFIKDVDESKLIENQEDFKTELVTKLNEDLDFKNELFTLIEKSKKELSNYTQQNIYNNGNIEKQVNTGNITGNINL